VTVIEVFADVGCPFTHVGLRRFVARRAELGRSDVTLRVRAWPLEVVNGTPLDPEFIAEEIDDIRAQAAPDLFGGFTQAAFPASSLPALALAAAAASRDEASGEAMSLSLRDALFEQGRDIADQDVLDRLAADIGLGPGPWDTAPVLADHAEGVERGVIGSPHFFTPSGGFFCPALDVHRDDAGQLVVRSDPTGFEQFLATCFA